MLASAYISLPHHSRPAPSHSWIAASILHGLKGCCPAPPLCQDMCSTLSSPMLMFHSRLFPYSLHLCPPTCLTFSTSPLQLLPRPHTLIPFFHIRHHPACSASEGEGSNVSRASENH